MTATNEDTRLDSKRIQRRKERLARDAQTLAENTGAHVFIMIEDSNGTLSMFRTGRHASQFLQGFLYIKVRLYIAGAKAAVADLWDTANRIIRGSKKGLSMVGLNPKAALESQVQLRANRHEAICCGRSLTIGLNRTRERSTKPKTGSSQTRECESVQV
ncbi:hypothetical protein H2198_005050 [Neophaeococcomyces mojaviensis]|uniref:Uncharacterized protein n=1 Tax=Neophaeococcomyces mojaviensis TaxID=3383035 RepID=A0ACC3A7J9_9EURO|nr:hypothetical protein H2198_005050 [Knufia sp. JES_112]